MLLRKWLKPRYPTPVPKRSKSIVRLKYVPHSDEPPNEQTEQLAQFINMHSRPVIITGAGVSTESGIPDYRSEAVGLYARKNYKPMQHQDFIKSERFRQRYWARSFIGWSTYSSIQPSTPHTVLADWEQRGKIHWLITQNVDGLHTKVGAKQVTELHGTLYEVGCLNCDHTEDRYHFQQRLSVANQGWSVQSFEMGTDGDVFLTDEQIDGFTVQHCSECGGPVKPKIVFFGDNVPRDKVAFLHNKIKEADSVLVLGSSLQVYSAFRFVVAAVEQRKPVAAVNIGATRADEKLTLKVHARCGDILPRVNLR